MLFERAGGTAGRLHDPPRLRRGMTPRRREILRRYLGTGNAKACGVSASLVRRIVREECARYRCTEFELIRFVDRREKRGGPDTVQIWNLARS